MATSRKTAESKMARWDGEDRYLELIRRFPLRPLRNAADLAAAIAVVDSLIDRDTLSVSEQDYLDILSRIVEEYEEKAVPMTAVDDAEMLRFLIEQNRVTQAETAAGAGIAESTISEVLRGKRKLTRNQIGKLASYFQVEPGAFLADTVKDS